MFSFETKDAPPDEPTLVHNHFILMRSNQEYLFTRVGPALMRGHFADWAAHTAAELDYLTREQVIYHATIFVFIVIYKYVI